MVRNRRTFGVIGIAVIVALAVFLAVFLSVYINRDYYFGQKSPTEQNTFSAATGMRLYRGSYGYLIYGGMDGNSTVITYIPEWYDGYSYSLHVRLGEGFQIEEMHQAFKVTYATPSQVTIEKQDVILIRGYPGP